MQNILTRYIRVDIWGRKNYNKITVHQGESGIEYQVMVYQNADFLDLRSIDNLSVKVKAGNRDVSVTEDCTITVIGYASFTLTKAMTAASGNLECRLDLIVGNDTVATATFIMYVVPDPTLLYEGGGGDTPITPLGMFFNGNVSAVQGVPTVSEVGAGQ